MKTKITGLLLVTASALLAACGGGDSTELVGRRSVAYSFLTTEQAADILSGVQLSTVWTGQNEFYALQERFSAIGTTFTYLGGDLSPNVITQSTAGEEEKIVYVTEGLMRLQVTPGARYLAVGAALASHDARARNESGVLAVGLADYLALGASRGYVQPQPNIAEWQQLFALVTAEHAIGQSSPELHRPAVECRLEIFKASAAAAVLPACASEPA